MTVPFSGRPVLPPLIDRCPVICLEGTDGVGKSSVARNLSARAPNSVLVSVPVPNSLHYESIRILLKNGKAIRLKNAFQALCFRNRLDWQQNVLPALLTSSSLIILDRWKGSLFAYGLASGCDRNDIGEQMQALVDPDLSFLLIGPSRRASPSDGYESSNGLQEAASRHYAEWAETHSAVRVSVETETDVDAVANTVWRELQNEFGLCL